MSCSYTIVVSFEGLLEFSRRRRCNIQHLLRCILQDGGPYQIIVIVVEARCHSTSRQSSIILFLLLGTEAERLEYHRAKHFRRLP